MSFNLAISFLVLVWIIILVTKFYIPYFHFHKYLKQDLFIRLEEKEYTINKFRRGHYTINGLHKGYLVTLHIWRNSFVTFFFRVMIDYKPLLEPKKHIRITEELNSNLEEVTGNSNPNSRWGANGLSLASNQFYHKFDIETCVARIEEALSLVIKEGFPPISQEESDRYDEEWEELIWNGELVPTPKEPIIIDFNS